MAVLESEIRSGLIPQRRPFTRSEYYLMAKSGVFGPEERVELIEGDILTKAPIGPSHNYGVYILSNIIRTTFDAGYMVCIQSSLSLTDNNEPQPDIMVVLDKGLEYSKRNPNASEAVLVIEIAESTLEYDRKIKAGLYAKAGIPEYWIVNLVNRNLEVYRNPNGASYESVQVYEIGQSIQPLRSPGISIPIADFIWTD